MRKLVPCIALLTLLSHCAPQESPVQKTAAPAVTRQASPVPPVRVHHMINGEGSIYMPSRLCYLDEVVPGIRVNLRYCGKNNFVGRPIAGYTTGSRAILRRDAAECIKRAQTELNARGLGLLVWDAYRPHRAMQDFYEWSLNDDERMKEHYYPNITKRGIYEGKYIRRSSEHSLGIAVDVTILNLVTGQPLDMGSDFDFLDACSATRYTGITAEQHANRMLLRDTMDRAGMRNYKREWWHYFLKNRGEVERYDFPLCDTLIPIPDSQP